MRVSICSIGIAFLALSAAAVVEGQDAADKYLLLAAERTTTMQREIDDAAAKGFRVFGASPTDGSEAVILLEKSTDKYQYRLLAATRIGTLQKEITQASNDGFTLIAVARTGEHIAILERRAP